MPSTIAQKLKIKPGTTLLTIHAPGDFEQQLSPLPNDVTIAEKASDYAQLHWFVQNKAQLDKEVSKIMKLLRDEVVCWCYYPKGTSKMQTDLTRDKGWELLLQQPIQWLSLISFNDTWSTFAFRLKTEADTKKEAAKPVREIFNYIDPVAKTITLPDDLKNALQKHKTEAAFFNQLSFSNRKEYVEWIVTAKRPETRSQRITGTIERLGKEWKNPANR